MPEIDVEALWAELDELGEESVRHNLAKKVYREGQPKIELVREWLRQREEARMEASSREQMRIARSAKNAAWMAAIAAAIAAICAIIATAF